MASVKQGVSASALKFTYDCYLPASQPLRKPQGPLPLQTTPEANLEWASVFVEHAGHLIKAREQDHEKLANNYHSAKHTIENQNADIKKLTKDNKDLHDKIERLQADLACETSAHKRVHVEFDAFKAEAKKEREALTKELAATRKEVMDGKAHDVLDEKALENLRKSNQKEREKNAALQAERDEKIKQLLKTKADLEAAENAQKVAGKKIDTLNGEITHLKQDVKYRDIKIENCESDLAAKKAELSKVEEELSASRGQVTGLTDSLAKQAKTIEDIETQLKNQKIVNTKLQAKNDKYAQHIEEDKKKLAKRIEEDERRKAETEAEKASLNDLSAEDDEVSVEQPATNGNGVKDVKPVNGAQVTVSQVAPL
ncbi:uncharacterized protein LY89DRAFT_741634 [Mollisia scopiformis]|uniref:Uncharacterized protein n=1 Tax=Mollisia scopiformis TaxID=149040 RepID=A0A132BAV8_MOLSC|nr:uncharacterized protein LY89DRAFT_741634 [Mollisia scopiformis]KUJ08797.1 hypothetical protein LY89DRAFT_741634 [Mollisia scopiformis]